jgi:hypothetical protein
MNYQQLTSAIRGYAENDFPATVGNLSSADQIALFVQQAEQRVYNSVQIPALRKNVTGTTTAGNKYLTLPGDWLATYSVAVIDPVTGEYEYMLDKDVNFIRQAYPFPAVSGKPQYYAIFDQDTYIMGPTPDQVYQIEMHYYYYPPSITQVGTSWLGQHFDSVLLYGALLEAAAFMKESDQEIVGTYTARYNEALALIKQLGEGKNRTDAYRTGQLRIPIR